MLPTSFKTGSIPEWIMNGVPIPMSLEEGQDMLISLKRDLSSMDDQLAQRKSENRLALLKSQSDEERKEIEIEYEEWHHRVLAKKRIVRQQLCVLEDWIRDARRGLGLSQESVEAQLAKMVARIDQLESILSRLQLSQQRMNFMTEPFMSRDWSKEIAS